MSIKIILLLSSLSFPMIPVVDNLPKHNNYFSFYLKRFHEYYKREFFNFSKIIKEEDLLNHIQNSTQWKEEGRRNLLWGIYHSKDQKISYVLRYKNKQGLLFEVNSSDSKLCERDDIGMRCNDKGFLIDNSNSSMDLSAFSLHPNGRFVFNDFVTEKIIYRDQAGNIVRIDYALNDVQAEWLPPKLKKIVYKIGYETRLPLDKLSFDNQGGIYVFYP